MTSPLVVFWDIDGTLLTTARAGIHAWEQAARDVLGTAVDFEDLPTAGRTDSQIATVIIEVCGFEATGDSVSRMLRSYEQHLPERLGWRQGAVLPNVREILDDLNGDPRVLSLLLTGNTAGGATAKLTHYGLIDDFADADGELLGAFCADGDDRDAIARRALQVAAKALGAAVSGGQAVVVGDTPHDVSCGRTIGARTLAVATGGFSADELRAAGAWHVVEELPDSKAFEQLLRT